jgi:uncharacterized protein (DUF885 family)
MNNFDDYGEGWALYAETLGMETDFFYNDPYARYGLLTGQLLRVSRLVVDTGLHWCGWSRQKAIEYMCEHFCDSPSEMAVEVDRYIVSPAQGNKQKKRWN